MDFWIRTRSGAAELDLRASHLEEPECKKQRLDKLDDENTEMVVNDAVGCSNPQVTGSNEDQEHDPIRPRTANGRKLLAEPRHKLS